NGVALKKLREDGLTPRLRAIGPDDLDKQRQRRRFHRHWTDRYGMTRYSGALEPEIGTPITARIDVETDRLVKEELGRGTTPAEVERDQLAADAFAKVCADGGKPHATKRDVVIVAGVNTIRTGQFTEGEPCHVLSPNGPIPISPDKVRAYLDEDSFVKLVLHDGIDVTRVAHVGRKTSAELRTALTLGSPPQLHG